MIQNEAETKTHETDTDDLRQRHMEQELGVVASQKFNQEPPDGVGEQIDGDRVTMPFTAFVSVHHDEKDDEIEGGFVELYRMNRRAGGWKDFLRNLTFQDLMSFVPLWVDNIELRRALLLRRSMDDGD